MDGLRGTSKRSVLGAWKLEAEAQLARVLRRLEPLEAQKRELETRIEAIRTLLDLEKDGQPERESGARTHTLADSILTVLRESGRPMHYTDVLSGLQARAVQVKGQDQQKTVRTYLSRDDRFENVGRGMWALSAAVMPVADAVVTADPAEAEVEYDPLADDPDTGGDESQDKPETDADMDYDPFAEE